MRCILVLVRVRFGVDAATMAIESDEANYLQTELSSLGIECKQKNELNDNEELQALTTAIKEVYFQDYKTAYNLSKTEIDQSHFDHLI
jgi:hypothetical protein